MILKFLKSKIGYLLGHLFSFTKVSTFDFNSVSFFFSPRGEASSVRNDDQSRADPRSRVIAFAEELGNEMRQATIREVGLLGNSILFHLSSCAV